MFITYEDIKWVYDQVHSQMFYNGMNVENAIETVFAKFDETVPPGLKDQVTLLALQRKIASLERAIRKARKDGDWGAVKAINEQIEYHLDCLIDLDQSTNGL